VGLHVLDRRLSDVTRPRGPLIVGAVMLASRLAADSSQHLSFDGRLGVLVGVVVAVADGRLRQQPVGVTQGRRVGV